MNTKLRSTVKLAAGLSVVAIMGTAATAVAGPWGVRDCLPGIQCLDVYNPVTCSNGVTYSNGCYAAKACATGCSAGIDS